MYMMNCLTHLSFYTYMYIYMCECMCLYIICNIYLLMLDVNYSWWFFLFTLMTTASFCAGLFCLLFVNHDHNRLYSCCLP